MQHVHTLEQRSEAAHAPLEPAPRAHRLAGIETPGAGFVMPRSASEGLPPILVADDDVDDIYFIERLIKKTGIKNPIKAFNDGSEVVNYLGALLAGGGGAHRIPSLLFLDLKMAGLGGFGFLEWAREQKGRLPLTTVVLSNSSQSADMSLALTLGAHRYLVKYPCVQTITTIVRSVYPFTLA